MSEGLDLLPSAEDVLQMEPEELAGFAFEYLCHLAKSQNGLVHLSFLSSDKILKKYDSPKRDECLHAFMESWMVLLRESLVAPRPGMPDTWLFITRRGRTIKNRIGLKAHLHAALFPKSSIHPDLLDAYPSFLRGDYEIAIVQAFRNVEIRVRNLCPNADKDLYGVALMRKAFDPKSGPLSDQVEPTSEREALSALFAGSFGRFRNPASHRHVPITAPTEAVEIIQIASALLRVLDDREASKGK